MVCTHLSPPTCLCVWSANRACVFCAFLVLSSSLCAGLTSSAFAPCAPWIPNHNLGAVSVYLCVRVCAAGVFFCIFLFFACCIGPCVGPTLPSPHFSPFSQVKRNNEISHNHFRKDWARHIHLWLDQPGKKKARRALRASKATRQAPRPLAGLLKPIVRPSGRKYNTRLREGVSVFPFLPIGQISTTC